MNRLRWYIPVIRTRHLFIVWDEVFDPDHCLDCGHNRRNWRHWGNPAEFRIR